ncbi:MAG: AcvB/VirJ family lysyl-phosphatidylglycerol hydrolase [Opitutaceae bacterium]
MNRALLLLLGLGAAAVLGAAPASLEDTLELPAQTPVEGATFAIFLTGDGGWAALDRQVAARLARADVPVVGWNSRAYFWTRRTPEDTAADLGRLVRRFRGEWKRERVIVVGYSRGADVLPFLVNRLAPEERAALRLVALLGPGRTIDFEFHVSDFLKDPDPRTALAVPPEVAKLRGLPLLIVHGEDDADSSAAEIAPDVGRFAKVPGDHHFNRDYDKLAALILEAAGVTMPASVGAR